MTFQALLEIEKKDVQEELDVKFIILVNLTERNSHKLKAIVSNDKC